MKINFMMIFRNNISCMIFMSLLTVGSQACAVTGNLLDQYEQVKDSFLPKSMRFQCGDDIYQIKRQPALGLSLSRKENLDWAKVGANIQFRDSGVVFETQGSGGIQKNAIRPKVTLPFYVGTKQQDVMDYLIVNQGMSNLFKRTVDFQQSKMTIENVDPVRVVLYLDADKYLKTHENQIKINPKKFLKQEADVKQAEWNVGSAEAYMKSAIDNEALYLSRVEQQRQWGSKEPEKVAFMKSRAQASQELADAKEALRNAKLALSSAQKSNLQASARVMQKAREVVSNFEVNPPHVTIGPGENKATVFCRPS